MKQQVKNVLVRLLILVLSPFKVKKREKNRILVVSTTGLGDTIWATGVLYSLKLKNPTLTIDCLTTPLGLSIFKGHKGLHEIYVLKKNSLSQFFFLFRTLKKNGYENIYLFHASQRIIFPLIKLLNPEKIIGSANGAKGLEFLFDETTKHENIHEIERRYLIAEKNHGNLQRLPLYLHSSEETDTKIRESILAEYGTSSYVMVQPFAKDGFKHWPLSSFKKLIQELKKHFEGSILITGSEEERKLLKPLEEERVFCIAGSYSLSEVSSLIKQARLLITNDTGPMHIGFAHQTPTVALFSPTNPEICGPYLSKNYKILFKKSTCFPCIKRGCKDPFCMRQISEKEVLDASLELLCP